MAESSVCANVSAEGYGAACSYSDEGGAAEAVQDRCAMSALFAEDASTVVGTLQAVGPYGADANSVGVEIDGKWYPSSDDLDLSNVARLVVGGAEPAVEATVKFELKMGGYAFGNGDPYAASGSISYEIKKVPSDEAAGMPRSGYGPVAFTDMEAFCDQVAEIEDRGGHPPQCGWPLCQ